MNIKDLMPFKKKDVSVKREEDNPIASLRRDIDSLFDNFFMGFAMEPLGDNLSVFSPSIDITETDKEIKVTAELPGMDEKDIDVFLNKDTLTIKGEKKEEKEDKGKNYYRVERSFGSFRRTIHLPVEIETDKIEAKFKKGVLTVNLPKSAKAMAEKKKIAIKTD